MQVRGHCHPNEAASGLEGPHSLVSVACNRGAGCRSRLDRDVPVGFEAPSSWLLFSLLLEASRTVPRELAAASVSTRTHCSGWAAPQRVPRALRSDRPTRSVTHGLSEPLRASALPGGEEASDAGTFSGAQGCWETPGPCWAPGVLGGWGVAGGASQPLSALLPDQPTGLPEIGELGFCSVPSGNVLRGRECASLGTQAPPKLGLPGAVGVSYC